MLYESGDNYTSARRVISENALFPWRRLKIKVLGVWIFMKLAKYKPVVCSKDISSPTDKRSNDEENRG